MPTKEEYIHCLRKTPIPLILLNSTEFGAGRYSNSFGFDHINKHPCFSSHVVKEPVPSWMKVNGFAEESLYNMYGLSRNQSKLFSSLYALRTSLTLSYSMMDYEDSFDLLSAAYLSNVEPMLIAQKFGDNRAAFFICNKRAMTHTKVKDIELINSAKPGIGSLYYLDRVNMNGDGVYLNMKASCSNDLLLLQKHEGDQLALRYFLSGRYNLLKVEDARPKSIIDDAIFIDKHKASRYKEDKLGHITLGLLEAPYIVEDRVSSTLDKPSEEALSLLLRRMFPNDTNMLACFLQYLKGSSHYSNLGLEYILRSNTHRRGIMKLLPKCQESSGLSRAKSKCDPNCIDNNFLDALFEIWDELVEGQYHDGTLM